MRVEFQID